MAKPRKKKVRYRKICFKVSEKQKSIIDRFCRAKQTSPNKMIKAAILDYIGKYAAMMPANDYVSKNQLQLFELDDDITEESEEFLAAEDGV